MSPCDRVGVQADSRSHAPVATANPEVVDEDDEASGLAVDLTRRNVLAFGAFIVLSLVALYYLIPRLAGVEETWNRIDDGDPYWLALALLFAVGSFAGYVALFRGVFLRRDSRIGWREAYQITMAGLAATRLFAAGGAGGIVLTAWALRRSGMPRRAVADATVSFLVLTYAVYMAALVVLGIGLRVGILSGPAPWATTVVPAVFGGVALAVAFAIGFIPTDLERRLSGFGKRSGRLGHWAQRAAHIPAAASAGVRDAIYHARTLDPALIGAVLFWAFQIAVLWAGFRAFGDAPPFAVLVMGFFLGMFGNLLPMPGGVGGVEGGMVGAFLAFGVDGEHALVAVLVYRAFVFWLPTVPGAIAYLQLRKTVERWDTERAAPAPGVTIA